MFSKHPTRIDLVGSQSNETFSIELSTSDAEKVRSHSPSEKITMIVTLKRALLEELVRQRRLTRLNVPRYHKLLPEVSLVTAQLMQELD